MTDDPMERLVRSLKDDLDAVVSERDHLRAKVQGGVRDLEGVVSALRAVLDEGPRAHTRDRVPLAERARTQAVVDAAIELVDAHRAWIEKAKGGSVRSTDDESHRRAAAMATLGTYVDLLKEGK